MATHDGCGCCKTGFVSVNWWLAAGCVRDSGKVPKNGTGSQRTRTEGVQGFSLDCIGRGVRRKCTNCAVAASLLAAHVRAKVGSQSCLWMMYSVPITRAGDGQSTTAQVAPGSDEGPYAVVLLLAPASRSCSRVGRGAKDEVHAARPSDLKDQAGDAGEHSIRGDSDEGGHNT